MKHWVRICVAAAVAFGATVLGWRILAGPNWSDAANAGIRVLQGQDAAQALPFIDEEELRTLRLSRQGALPILAMVSEGMKPFKVDLPNGPPVIHGAKTVLTFDIKAPKATYHWGIEVFETNQGPRVSLSLLCLAVLRGIMEDGKAGQRPDWQKQFNSTAERFRRAGVPGYWDIASGNIQQWPILREP
jgi:hypothetical protein